MGIEISRQTLELCLSALMGGALCMFYDFERLIRGRAKSRIVTAILDFLFWLVICLAVIWFALGVLGGEFRLFMIFGIAAGSVLWYLLLSKAFLGIGFKIIDAVLWLFRQLIRPFVYAVGKIYALCVKLSKKRKNYFKLVKKHSMIGDRSIYNTHGRLLRARRKKYREAEKNRADIQGADDSGGGVRRGQPAENTVRDKRRAGRNRRAERPD